MAQQAISAMYSDNTIRFIGRYVKEEVK